MNFECGYERYEDVDNDGSYFVGEKCKVERIYKTYNGSKKNDFHASEYRKNEVVFFEISNKFLANFPKNLHEDFPNLRRLHVIGCGLTEISHENLCGFKQLQVLVLDNNKLTTLPDNLFEGLENLRMIYFENNEIERLSSNLLKPIEKTLKFADFTRNNGIDDYFDMRETGKNNLKQLMNVMDSLKPPLEVVARPYHTIP